MNGYEHISSCKASLRRRIVGSALSTLVGWLTLAFVLLGGTIYEGAQRTRPTPFEWEGFAMTLAFGFVFVLVTWLVLLLPLYLFVPLHSMFWRWPICTLCGALAGAVIMFGFYGFSTRGSGTTSMIILAAITGAATCLFGALTASRFHHVSPATKVA